MSAREASALTVRVQRFAPRADHAGQVVRAGAVLAWIALLGMSLPMGGGMATHVHGSLPPPGAVTDAAAAASVEASTPGWVGAWLLMTATMMWPLMAPTVDRTAQAAYPRWRIALAATTLATATALWLALGLVAALAAQMGSVPVGSVWWQLAFLGVAALAWGSARRSRLLAKCAKLPPIAPGGARGLKTAVSVGLVSWKRCAVLCGPLMIAMVVGHNPVVLVAASASVWWEAWHPRAWRDRVPLALILVACLGTIAGGVLAS
jgi:hypothetical protein